jgi:hypothetical protein
VWPVCIEYGDVPSSPPKVLQVVPVEPKHVKSKLRRPVPPTTAPLPTQIGNGVNVTDPYDAVTKTAAIYAWCKVYVSLARGPTTSDACSIIPCEYAKYYQRWCATTMLGSACGATPSTCNQGGADCETAEVPRNAYYSDPSTRDWELELPWVNCPKAFRCVMVYVDVLDIAAGSRAQTSLSKSNFLVPATFDKTWYYYHGFVGSNSSPMSYSVWNFAINCQYY